VPAVSAAQPSRIAALWRRLWPSKPEAAPSSVPAPASDEPSLSDPAEAERIGNVQDFNPLPPEASDTALSSEQIFAEIGLELRRRREMLSLTYDEVERHTHVRAAFLAALEGGALEELPSPVQTRGILANYASFLDLNADAILLRFADGLQARHRERGPQQPGRSRPPMTVNTRLPPLRSFIASDLVFGGGVAIMLLLFAVWGISRVIAVRSEAVPLATAPSISDVLAGTPLPTLSEQVTVIPAQDTPVVGSAEAPLDIATLDANVRVQVNLTATERTYVRVMVDGKLQFEGRTQPSGQYSYQAANQVEVLVGNAAALRVNYNGRDLGLMGNFGEVVDRLYTAEGIATPTPTLPPTRTPTPHITATSSTTPTVTPSVTRTPKPGG
jgi:cytoskeleton protein RodZ